MQDNQKRKESTLLTIIIVPSMQLVRNSPRDTIHDPHPIIGLILLAVIFFQPFFGLMHHLLFKRHLRRTIWSYAHLWLGRIVITLGIINGGLGLRLARKFPLGPPSRGAMIGYGIAAGFMWLLYVLAVLLGERKRRKVRRSAAQMRGGVGKDDTSSHQSSSHNTGEA